MQGAVLTTLVKLAMEGHVKVKTRQMMPTVQHVVLLNPPPPHRPSLLYFRHLPLHLRRLPLRLRRLLRVFLPNSPHRHLHLLAHLHRSYHSQSLLPHHRLAPHPISMFAMRSIYPTSMCLPPLPTTMASTRQLGTPPPSLSCTKARAPRRQPSPRPCCRLEVS